MNHKKRRKKNAKAKRWGVVVVIELLLIIILIPALYIYLKLYEIRPMFKRVNTYFASIYSQIY
jgi:hypothetical protein